MMFSFSCGMSFGLWLSSFGLLLPARLLLLLLSDITETESVACTKLEMLGMLWACDVPFAFGAPLGEARPVEVGVLSCSWDLVCGGVDVLGVPFT
jgi:hypothetical protein